MTSAVFYLFIDPTLPTVTILLLPNSSPRHTIIIYSQKHWPQKKGRKKNTRQTPARPPSSHETTTTVLLCQQPVSVVRAPLTPMWSTSYRSRANARVSRERGNKKRRRARVYGRLNHLPLSSSTLFSSYLHAQGRILYALVFRALNCKRKAARQRERKREEGESALGETRAEVA